MFARAITLALAALAIAISLLVWRTDARSSNLGALSALCSANPHCSQTPGRMEGSILFRIRGHDALLRLECSGDGTCLRVEPKSARTSIVNAAALISSR
ncbi:MAG: hypothetical protein JNM20_12300 [Rhizobiales bacterium]|nr:hypothetical protein [Hyphomicrobiales bacterium]